MKPIFPQTRSNVFFHWASRKTSFCRMADCKVHNTKVLRQEPPVTNKICILILFLQSRCRTITFSRLIGNKLLRSEGKPSSFLRVESSLIGKKFFKWHWNPSMTHDFRFVFNLATFLLHSAAYMSPVSEAGCLYASGFTRNYNMQWNFRLQTLACRVLGEGNVVFTNTATIKW